MLVVDQPIRVEVDSVHAMPDQNSIFQQPWWLEAAGGANLERAEVRWDGQVVASLAFVRERRLGFTLLDMPPYTRTLGLTLALPSSKPAKRWSNMQEAVAELMAALPPHDRFQMTLAPEDPTGFPLVMCGCSLGQSYTFRVPARWDDDRHWIELDQKTRNVIRSASREMLVEETDAIEPLLELTERERGSKNRADAETLRRIAEAARSRAQMTTLTARRDGGPLVAAATVIWDSRVLYFWQSGRDVGQARSGTNSLLVWKAMLLARSKGLIFDVDGYHSQTSARFVSRFGMEPVIRTSVLHLSRRGRMLQAAGRIVGRGTGFGVQPVADRLA